MGLTAGALRPRRLPSGAGPPTPPAGTDTLHHLTSLPAGWCDGRGQPVTPEVLTAATRALESIRARHLPAPQIGVEPDGPAFLQWTSYPTATVPYLEGADTCTLLRTDAETGDTCYRGDLDLPQAIEELSRWELP